MDLLMLSRLQFAVTAAFHYIYPPLTIGLGVILVIIEGTYLKTRDKKYLEMAKFWARIFGLTFAIGVATGIVMEFEFGTNWANYSRYVGDVFGSALAAEGIFAFFLESGFLALLLFGWDKISPRLHFISSVLVCLGAHFSAVWIIVANSWMQTPAGYHIVKTATGTRAEITNFWALVFNPSSMDRLSHVLMGAWQAGAFLVISISAYYLLKKKNLTLARFSMKVGLIVALIASLGQLVTGHFSGREVARYQPAKLAAFEGHYASTPAGMYLFGWVNEKSQTVHGVEIPGLLSWLVHGNAKAPVTGLNAFPQNDRPPVNIVFQTFHLMVAIGMILILISVIGMLMLWRGKLFDNTFMLTVMVFSVLGPQLANQLGWMSAEIGRQPWIVYGLMRTSQGLSQTVTAGMVMTSLTMFTIIYIFLFILFIYLLDRKIKAGPQGAAHQLSSLQEGGQRA